MIHLSTWPSPRVTAPTTLMPMRLQLVFCCRKWRGRLVGTDELLAARDRRRTVLIASVVGRDQLILIPIHKAARLGADFF